MKTLLVGARCTRPDNANHAIAGGFVKLRGCFRAHAMRPLRVVVISKWLERKLAPKEVLQAKLHKALLEAKARLEFQRVGDSDE
jgi:hypothetical protein